MKTVPHVLNAHDAPALDAFALPAGLFADAVVTVSPEHWQGMLDLITAVETVVQRPAWADYAWRDASGLAATEPAAQGVFFGYDFHLCPEGPQLIEINTNAGGGWLNALAQERGQWAEFPRQSKIIEKFFSMFRNEEACSPVLLSEADKSRRVIAMVDEAPEQQFLYPEFQLCQQALASQGWSVVIADPADFRFDGECLWVACDDGEHPVSLVYNRLTDFALTGEAVSALREAYLQHKAVITPHPHAYARYADKRHLVTLSDAEQLRAMGVDEATIAVLQRHIPATRVVRADDEATLWAERKQLFFKPMVGFGSRAAYRGDKLTKRVFGEILQGNYVAQRLAPPPEIDVRHENALIPLKYDVRLYVYRGSVQLACARLWSGQTTNFRTPGGGFAPVQVTEHAA